MNREFIRDYERMTFRRYKFGIRFILDLIFRQQIKYMYLFRKYQKSHSLLTRLWMYRLTRRFGLEISPNAIIGMGLYIGHPFNITVAADVRMGQNVNIHKGCTIGMENRGDRKGCPTIGNNVYIGINATVVGKVTIGDDVMIGANTFVNFDVPSHSIVTSEKAVIHHSENATRNYVVD